jgi:hypothetical protein
MDQTGWRHFITDNCTWNWLRGRIHSGVHFIKGNKWIWEFCMATVERTEGSTKITFYINKTVSPVFWNVTPLVCSEPLQCFRICSVLDFRFTMTNRAVDSSETTWISARIHGVTNLMCSMSVHCIIRNKHQLIHQNIYNLYSWESPTCFDPAGPSSGRIVLIDYGCVYTVKCECALGFILRLRGIVYCPRSSSIPGISCTVRGHPPFERYRVLSAVILRLRDIVYCPRSSSVWEVSSTVRGHPPFERYRVLSAVILRLRDIVYCPRSSSVWEVSSTVRGLCLDTDRGQYTVPLKRRMKPRAHSHLTV